MCGTEKNVHRYIRTHDTRRNIIRIFATINFMVYSISFQAGVPLLKAVFNEVFHYAVRLSQFAVLCTRLDFYIFRFAILNLAKYIHANVHIYGLVPILRKPSRTL